MGLWDMKRAFVSLAGKLTSVLVPEETPSSINLGDRLIVESPLYIGLNAQLQNGERGTVMHIYASTGGLEVLMDVMHEGLTAWHNHILLEPYGTEEMSFA